MKKSIFKTVSSYYSEKLLKYGATSKGVDWNDKNSHFLRFEQLDIYSSINKRFSILDYGCGFGSLIEYLNDKKYDFDYFENLANQFNFRINKNIGLTYPLSNILYLISNRIIKKKESDKLKLSLHERTVYTGNRNIKYKTTFPKGFNLILNPISLYAFHLLQRIFSKNKNNLVIYSELTLNQP